MTSRYTAGPWTVEGRKISAPFVARHIPDHPGNGQTIVIASTHFRSNGLQIGASEAEANARLIAAAPEMKSVLHRVHAFLMECDGADDVLADVARVLDKAEAR